MADKQTRLLDKSDVFKAYRSWMVWNLSCQNMERMEGPAIIRMMGMVKDKLYPGDREKQKEMLERHEPFFNTEPYLGCIVPGVVLGMEEENARSGEVPGELINGMKTALMGPFAGIGDSLYVGTLIPILLSIALGISGESGSVVGPILYIILHLAIMVPVTWLMFSQGYNLGVDAASKLLGGGLKDALVRAMNIVGLMVVGCITSQYVNVSTALVFQSGEMVVDVNASLNGIMPNMVTMVLALVTYYLMGKKKYGMGKMFIIYACIAVVNFLIGLGLNAIGAGAA